MFRITCFATAACTVRNNTICGGAGSGSVAAGATATVAIADTTTGTVAAADDPAAHTGSGAI